MKRTILALMVLVLMTALCACGKSYECRRCEKTTSKIYYDIDGDASLCADCAKEYWAPFDYRNYKVR